MKKFIFILLVFITILLPQQNSWISPNPCPGKLNGIFFRDSLHGWAVGNNSSIVKTTDGGRSWLPQKSPNFSNFNDVYFSDSEHGIIVGGDGGYAYG
ncbi:MAG: hypothetical protein GF313_13690, partial [Caldithrix sp.]|nr:hypothetical protein [Caldithrix sp.]